MVADRTRASRRTITAILLLGVVLVTQYLRHDWPFPSHPGILDAAAPEASPASATASVAHPRVTVDIDAAQARAIGLRLETVRRDQVTESLRVVATVVLDESLVSQVRPSISGWLEALHVDTIGQTVRAGEPIASIFSQELLATQAEYLAALRAARFGPRGSVVESARGRLKELGMSDAEITEMEQIGEPRRLTTVLAPRSGIVLRRSVNVGTSVDSATEILTLADLSSVWIIAEVPETGLELIPANAKATIDFASSGRKPFEARVNFVYPLTERTHTVRARFVVQNADGKLRPGMYGNVDLRGLAREAATVSRNAVVDTGAQQHVFVATAPDHYEPRTVTLGARLGDRVEIRSGLVEGERVVAAGVFLLDSESRLRAADGGDGPTAPASGADSSAADAPLEGHAG